MELKELVRDLTVAVDDEVCDSVRRGFSNGTVRWYVDDGHFNVECYDVNDSVSVECFDNKGRKKNAPLLCSFLKRKLDEHDFWQEARDAYPDENPNPGLDPAFSSWNDFYDFKYR